MTEYGHRVLYLSGPVEAPWTRSDKNLVRGVASNLKRYRARVLTHEGAIAPAQGIEVESAWGPRLTDTTALGRRVGLFARLIESSGVSLVHLFWPADHVVAQVVRAACKLRNLPVVHTLVRAPRTMVGIGSAVAGQPTVALTAATTERLRNEGLRHVLHIPPGIELHEPIAPGERAAILRKYRIPMDKPVVIYAGDYGHSNAARTVAAAIPRVLRQVDAHFVLACRLRTDADRTEEQRIQQACTADGVAQHVTFLNEVSSLRELFAIAAVQVFPADSHHEKMELPLVLLEGMAERLATVVASKAPLTELVQAGAALGVPPMDPVSLAVPVVDLLRSEERRLALGEAARQIVQQRFDIKRISAQYEEVYDEMLARHRARQSSVWGRIG